MSAATVEPRRGRRANVFNFVRSTSLRLSQEESDLIDELGDAMRVSNAEVLRFFVRKHGPAYLAALKKKSAQQKP